MVSVAKKLLVLWSELRSFAFNNFAIRNRISFGKSRSDVDMAITKFGPGEKFWEGERFKL